jgi:hypothetical protein
MALVWRAVVAIEAAATLLAQANDSADARCERVAARRFDGAARELARAQAGLLEVATNGVSPTINELGEVLAPTGLWST